MIKHNQSHDTSHTKKSVFYSEEDLSRVPPLNLGVPSSRRQVEMLASWLAEISDHVNAEKGLNERERVEKLIIAHKFALMEVNRQVSVQCLERGDLLKQIIDQFVALTIRYVRHQTKIENMEI